MNDFNTPNASHPSLQFGSGIPVRQLLRCLRQNGFQFLRQSGTSHMQWGRDTVHITVPCHGHGNQNVSFTVLKSIARQLNMTCKQLKQWISRA